MDGTGSAIAASIPQESQSKGRNKSGRPQAARFVNPLADS